MAPPSLESLFLRHYSDGNGGRQTGGKRAGNGKDSSERTDSGVL